VRALIGRGQGWTDEECDAVLESPAGQHVRGMTKYAAIGVQDEVGAYLARFAALAGADEIMTVHPAPTADARLRSVEILARARPTGERGA
jgi:alkanesulfonate monooxygenase SsuD/methylene tetrahydromethanopterin reductase-like flavin-dependent oxidoreductase (luciferase family)